MNPEYIHYFNWLTGLGVIILQALSLLALAMLVFRQKNFFLSFIKKYALHIGFSISLVAVLTSVIYSEVIGWVPCFFCWMDRIFIFPQAAIFTVALIKKDRTALWYSLILTLFGFVNSIVHFYEYYFAEGTAPCDASGVSCVQRLVSEFGGYISIPTNALSGFFALLVLFLVAYFYKED